MARGRIRAGQISERALARQSSISQPHFHNVLKGIRTLSPEAADRLMYAMDVSVPQVLWSDSALEISAAEIAAVPLLQETIGPGSPAIFTAFRGYLPFPARLIRRLTNPVSAYLAADLALPPEYQAGDLALMDLNPANRSAPLQSAGWVVAENAGLRVRYVRRVRNGLEVASALGSRANWRSISLQDRNILDIVRAQIVWIGREMERPLAGPSRPAREID